ncbi:N-6 DNA methylase [Pseudoalteromonas sp. 120-MNA-CIBAN-0494]|uniref:Eco57I restriction-modification methylase domain-containing protein n=2 Tax=Pseudoalteromonas TaxID=53246 RepID=UPI0033316AC0
MRTPLDKALRGKLEKTVEKARDIVEVAVTEALTRLGISDGSAPSYLSESERKLRTRLRAHGRQLGDVLNRDTGKQETELLVNEMAYEHWHRMLFSRFLEQSDLLMYDENTHVSLNECFELAEEEPDVKDGWELAGQLAQKMLPQIFRADSPVFDVKLSINHVNDLEELIATLDKETFQASDALGWCYQFWQNKKKKQVNESGVKIGAKELSPVTQLFTEPYMVSFLLDNALGAWWAKRRLTQDDLNTATSEQELRELASIPGVPLEYLRFVQDETTKTWSSAAGDFDKWPEDLNEFKTLDPCCGSGHFLVAKFLMLVPIRIELEGLTAKEAIDKVLAQNIHGLELDQRCIELAAFALALEAWRYPSAGGYRQLPELQLACSGVSITESQKEWKDLANENEELRHAITWMESTYKNAPTLGSLIAPKKALKVAHIKPWKVIEQELDKKKSASDESKATAKGLVIASELLAQQFHWVITNVPYLARGKQNEILQKFCDKYYPASKSDLATVFKERCLELACSNGIVSTVMPSNWLFLTSYNKFREILLNNCRFECVVKLGGGAEAFDLGPGNITNIGLFVLEKSKPNLDDDLFIEYDLIDFNNVVIKKQQLKSINIRSFSQQSQNQNPDFMFIFDNSGNHSFFSDYQDCLQGTSSGDNARYVQYQWETNENNGFDYLESVPKETSFYSGKNQKIKWAEVLKSSTSAIRGEKAFGSKGVIVGQMGYLPTSIYMGYKFPNTTPVIIPRSLSSLESIWEFCSSSQFPDELRKVNQKLSVDNGYVGKIKFEKEIWDSKSSLNFPNRIPEPHSNDITQWLYHGHPCASIIWNEDLKTTFIGSLREEDTVLQVAVARLLGYRWPAELDTEMELAPEMREVIAQNKVFDGLVDDDGIVCIPAIRGEKPAVDRLEAILHAAYGDKWSATVLNNLLKSVKSRDLNIWLRDKFFEQHCKLFQHRPFIWHIWDGLPDGFSALVNYHQLDYKGLERLIYTYLDDWISTQIQLEKDGDEGAEIRLAAARNLRKQLEDILVGEQGLDIFVRWKPLAEQPIGWNPDLNDGVRLNIRPFMKAKDVGKKDAGILRSKPNIHWKKDRGTDVESAPWYNLGLAYSGKQGDRINDHHLTLGEKKAVRDGS